MHPPLTDADAARRVSAVSERSYQLVRRLVGGETGASLFVDDRGREVVIKWASQPQARTRRRTAVALSERLRTEGGWPVPQRWAIDADEWLFVVSDFLPGAAVRRLDTSMVDELVALHSRQLGLARPGDPDHFAEDLIATLTEGGDNYCRHESLRGHSAKTRRLLEQIESIGHHLSPADLPSNDIVHWDLHAGNLLESRGRLAGIIDLDFVKVGDGAFDLVTLAISALEPGIDAETRSRLFAVGLEPLDETRRSAYVAHLLLRFIDWPIRKGRADEVAFWLAQAELLLPG